jgi:hypothetical protein
MGPTIRFSLPHCDFDSFNRSLSDAHLSPVFRSRETTESLAGDHETTIQITGEITVSGECFVVTWAHEPPQCFMIVDIVSRPSSAISMLIAAVSEIFPEAQRDYTHREDRGASIRDRFALVGCAVFVMLLVAILGFAIYGFREYLSSP